MIVTTRLNRLVPFSLSFNLDSRLRGLEVITAIVVINNVRDMIAKKFCEYGEY